MLRWCSCFAVVVFFATGVYLYVSVFTGLFVCILLVLFVDLSVFVCVLFMYREIYLFYNQYLFIYKFIYFLVSFFVHLFMCDIGYSFGVYFSDVHIDATEISTTCPIAFVASLVLFH